MFNLLAADSVVVYYTIYTDTPSISQPVRIKRDIYAIFFSTCQQPMCPVVTLCINTHKIYSMPAIFELFSHQHVRLLDTE